MHCWSAREYAKGRDITRDIWKIGSVFVLRVFAMRWYSSAGKFRIWQQSQVESRRHIA